MTRLKPQTPEFDKLADSLASDVEGTFDYAYGETPVIDLEDRPAFMVSNVSEKQYNDIDAALDMLIIKGKGYDVSASLIDSSGYAYWRNEGDYMQVMVTAIIENIELIDDENMARDMGDMRRNVLDVFDDAGIDHDNL